MDDATKIRFLKAMLEDYYNCCTNGGQDVFISMINVVVNFNKEKEVMSK